MWFDYILEREGLDSIITDYGFICFRIEGQAMWINDYYVKPEMRKSGKGKDLANMTMTMAKEAGCLAVFCQSDESANGHDVSRLAITNFGFKECGRKAKLIYYRLEVDEWEKHLVQ